MKRENMDSLKASMKQNLLMYDILPIIGQVSRQQLCLSPHQENQPC